MGETDWMRHCDEDYGKICVEAQRKENNCHFYILAGAGHNMHLDKPIETADIIIKDLLGLENSSNL